MVGIQHFLGMVQVFFDAALFAPRHSQKPVEIVANNGRLGRHRAHGFELLHLRIRFFTRFFRQFRLGDLFFQLSQLTAAIFAFAQFFLNRLHLLVQIIFALGFLHLTLHAPANFLLNLQHADFAFHMAENGLKAFFDIDDFQQGLLFIKADIQMTGNRIG